MASETTQTVAVAPGSYAAIGAVVGACITASVLLGSAVLKRRWDVKDAQLERAHEVEDRLHGDRKDLAKWLRDERLKLYVDVLRLAHQAAAAVNAATHVGEDDAAVEVLRSVDLHLQGLYAARVRVDLVGGKEVAHALSELLVLFLDAAAEVAADARTSRDAGRLERRLVDAMRRDLARADLDDFPVVSKQSVEAAGP